MKTQLSLAALALAAGFATAALAQGSTSPPPPAVEVSAGRLAITNLPAKGGAKLTVSTPAFKDMQDIPYENTQYRGNKFPGLSWSKGPASTKSYAIIMQDTDVKLPNGNEVLHWTMYNIPANTTSLPAGMTDAIPGAAHGPNVRGPVNAYMGPRTPAGPKHRYHIQVFALDTTIAKAPANYDELVAAMKDHVVASGQVIGLGSVDPTAPPPAPRPAA
jgi:para-nitrobenzyl esterase